MHHHRNRSHVSVGVGSGLGTWVVGATVGGGFPSDVGAGVGAEVTLPEPLPGVPDWASCSGSFSSSFFFLSSSFGDFEAEGDVEGSDDGEPAPVLVVPSAA